MLGASSGDDVQRDQIKNGALAMYVLHAEQYIPLLSSSKWVSIRRVLRDFGVSLRVMVLRSTQS